MLGWTEIKLDPATTPDEMRKALFLVSRDHYLVRRVMMMSDMNGLSGEDRYTVMAYHAVKAMLSNQRRLEELLCQVPPKMIIKEP